MREREILNAAEELFLMKGFGGTTIGDIAKACELTNGAIYLYFKNKSEIILIVMTRISNSFADLLEQADDRTLPGMERAERLFGVYRSSFRDYHSYHVLDGQFNVIFDRQYPDSPFLDDFFRANKRVLDIFTDLFETGFRDGTVAVPSAEGDLSPIESARMFLNVVNSYVEKLSLRKELMEREQGVSMERELDVFLGYLVESLRSTSEK